MPIIEKITKELHQDICQNMEVSVVNSFALGRRAWAIEITFPNGVFSIVLVDENNVRIKQDYLKSNIWKSELSNPKLFDGLYSCLRTIALQNKSREKISLQGI